MPMHNPAHPGKVLKEIMQGRTVGDVAKHLGVTRAALSRVLNERAGVSAEMAIRLGKAFNNSPEFWLRMQAGRDLWVASQKKVKVKPLPPLETAA